MFRVNNSNCSALRLDARIASGAGDFAAFATSRVLSAAVAKGAFRGNVAGMPRVPGEGDVIRANSSEAVCAAGAGADSKVMALAVMNLASCRRTATGLAVETTITCGSGVGCLATGVSKVIARPAVPTDLASLSTPSPKSLSATDPGKRTESSAVMDLADEGLIAGTGASCRAMAPDGTLNGAKDGAGGAAAGEGAEAVAPNPASTSAGAGFASPIRESRPRASIGAADGVVRVRDNAGVLSPRGRPPTPPASPATAPSAAGI